VTAAAEGAGSGSESGGGHARPDPSRPLHYAELHCRSNFSFLHGASHPEELVERAHALGYAALAITDEASLAGVVRAHVKARVLGLRLLVGSEIRLQDGPRLVLLAVDRGGYAGLCHLLTLARRSAPKGCYLLERSALQEGLPGCLALLIPPADLALPAAQLHWFAERFRGVGWIAVELWRDGRDSERLRQLGRWSSEHGLPLTAAGGVLMHDAARRPLLDLLTAIRLVRRVDALGQQAAANGERHLRPLPDLAQLYPAELLAESVAIAERCRFSLDELRYEYPDEVTPADETPRAFLQRLTWEGAARRWPDGCPPRVRQQIGHELELIGELRYEAYFLTVWDIVRFARSRDILCQGRGSAANSAVCYCLGITEVDPARMNLLFERFISRERGEPPDIDVDFEHERREEVIQYLYQKYGRDRAALAATLITYRYRSAIRDTGKAMGLSEDQLGRLSHAVSGWRRGGVIRPEWLAEAGLDPNSPVLRRTLLLANQLLGFPRHLSQHVGGFVIARHDLRDLVPVENAAMPDRTVIQWDKDDLEALGLLKVDVLGLGMLTAIRRAIDLINGFARHGMATLLTRMQRQAEAVTGEPAACCLVRETAAGFSVREGGSAANGEMSGRTRHPDPPPPGKQPGNPHDGGSRLCPDHPRSREQAAAADAAPQLSLAGIPAEDPAVYGMLQRADTMGVFQIESRAQMSMLPRLRPASYYDLVIEVAIVRPGPIQGEMVHPYLRRRQGLEAAEYPSEAVREVLERTLGVPIFQEQVIKLAMVAAGYSAGEADQLRRDMAAWKKRGGLEIHERRLKDGMCARGFSEEFADRVFHQILGFGEYGFPESHAASFALLVYVSAWLKHYHPAAFCAALLNSQPMGFYAPAQLVRDARDHGVEVLPPDIRSSDWDCTLEPAADGRPALRLGLRLVAGLSRSGAGRLQVARDAAPFGDARELARRARLNRADLKALAAADVLRPLSGHRRLAAWEVAGIEAALPLLQGAGFQEQRPALDSPSLGQEVAADYGQLGLSLRAHPLALLRRQLRQRCWLSAAEIAEYPPGAVVRAAGLVLVRQRPGKGNAVFITLEDETGSLNLIVWRDLAERQRRELLGSRLLGVRAEIQRAEGVQHLIVQRLEDLSALLGSIRVESRDFH